MDYFPRKLLSKYLITDTIDFNKHMHDNDIFINDKWRKYARGDSSKLQGDLNFAFDQRESEINLHKATSSPESPSNVSPVQLVVLYDAVKINYNRVLVDAGQS